MNQKTLGLTRKLALDLKPVCVRSAAFLTFQYFCSLLVLGLFSLGALGGVGGGRWDFQFPHGLSQVLIYTFIIAMGSIQLAHYSRPGG
ncbi:hypothetical protein EBZ37_15080, partial [bacterium]|nr:hypothetical protein [bacterium]